MIGFVLSALEGLSNGILIARACVAMKSLEKELYAECCLVVKEFKSKVSLVKWNLR